MAISRASEFLPGFGGFGEEGHVQLHFVSGVSSRPLGKVWRGGLLSRPCAVI